MALTELTSAAAARDDQSDNAVVNYVLNTCPWKFTEFILHPSTNKESRLHLSLPGNVRQSTILTTDQVLEILKDDQTCLNLTGKTDFSIDGVQLPRLDSDLYNDAVSHTIRSSAEKQHDDNQKYKRRVRLSIAVALLLSFAVLAIVGVISIVLVTRADAAAPNAPWSAILLHGNIGTQLYSPFMHPHGVNVTGELGIEDTINFSNTVKMGDDIYIMGGRIGNSWITTDRVQIFNVVSNTTRNGPTLPYPMLGMATFRLGETEILLCGGGIHNFTDVTNECYTFDLKTYTKVVNFPYQIRLTASVSLNGKHYIFGGLSRFNSTTEDDITDNAYVLGGSGEWNWVSLSPMKSAVYGPAAVALNTSTILVCGGYSVNSEAKDDCYYYHTLTNVWESTHRLQIKKGYPYMVGDFAGRIWCFHGLSPKVELFNETSGWEVLPEELAFIATASFAVAVE